ncbi:MAG: N-acetylglucosamine-6-phosphate deacetylase, partial [Frisingicoccus sp.]|nr:N-acetylglucosamine-6-phosphate deacetylase [Frisingicoccus sp.]
MKILNGLVFDLEQGFVARELYTKDGMITPSASDDADDPVIDASGCYVIPGLVDVHFHGCCG